MSFNNFKRKLLVALGLLLISFSPANAVEIDVLMLYSPEITSVSQGMDPAASAAAFIAYANETYNKSNVNIRLRRVGGMREYSGESGISGTALRNLAGDQRVADLRSQYGADLVALLTLRQQTVETNGELFFSCGIGYKLEGSNGRFYSWAKYAAFSVSAVNCGSVTPVHEWGHNMGLGHSYVQYEQRRDGEVQRSRGGIYEWARGHGEFNNFATIMAYAHAYGSARRIQQFSSPNQFKCNGLRCGVYRNQFNGADAVRNLNIVADQVAAFMPKKK